MLFIDFTCSIAMIFMSKQILYWLEGESVKTAIITGATGFVGVHLVEELQSHNVDVTALCREGSQNMDRLPPDVETTYYLDDLPLADVFYHLAWEGASGIGRGDATLQACNAELTLHSLLAAHRLRCSRFVALGTIYENFAPQIKASATSGSADFYILSKEYAHSMANQLAYKVDLEFVWCKICHPIGRFIKPEQMIAFVISNLLAGTKPSFGPALIPYDIVAVEDVAHGLYLVGCCDQLTKREYYIGSGSPKPLYRWLEDVRNVLGVDVPISIGEKPDDGLQFDESWFDITPLTMDTGYKPVVDLSDAVNHVVKWIKTSKL